MPDLDIFTGSAYAKTADAPSRLVVSSRDRIRFTEPPVSD